MRCVCCSMPIYPKAPRIVVGGGPAHAECALERARAEWLEETDRSFKPVVSEDGRRLTVWYKGGLEERQDHRLTLHVTRGEETFVIGLGTPLVVHKMAVIELAEPCRIYAGDQVILDAQKAIGGLPVAASFFTGFCENRSKVEHRVPNADAPGGRAEQGPIFDFGNAPELTIGPPVYERLARKAEKSGRSEIPDPQQVATFGSRRYPGLYIAVLGVAGIDYQPLAIAAILDDPPLDHMLMSHRLRVVVEKVAQAAGTDDVAGRYSSAPSSTYREATHVLRCGAFKHDHALWAEFLHAIG